ncbi:hypothetical protein [Dehalogenimonas alkenigignens]|uniref:Uncharacterized protein n=1 Tax=Dehalogenimonas alkenigignens TaxID=1217799 RepID=A0A0W0GHV4_9CHLR|nr:hypothetical protein [Dehalogenimonas alkenigignens]KTB48125.1 hypothetical protein DEALK_09700 [Dehalogenimonas alkenigignens]PVV84375.1 hypothetical protein DD509_03515 [Dehalogenimonas alkenigignens]
MLLALITLLVWIGLVWEYRRKKAALFARDEPAAAAVWLRLLRRFLWTGGISAAVFAAAAVIHNAASALIGIEEAVFFTLALAALVAFVIATGVSLLLYVRGRLTRG